MRHRFYVMAALMILTYGDLESQVISGTPLKSKKITITDCKVRIDDNTLLPKTVMVTAGNDTFSNYIVDNLNIIFDSIFCQKR